MINISVNNSCWVQDGYLLYCGATFVGNLPHKFEKSIAFIDGIDQGEDTLKLLISDHHSVCAMVQL